MITTRIRIQGLVQGVGYRPFVYHLALTYNLVGTVSNGSDGVHIVVTGSNEKIERFCTQLKREHPDRAIIQSFSAEEINLTSYNSFRIIESTKSGAPDMLLTPDVAICAECRQELKNAGDKRFQYPFTTCLNCGPRYSIIKDLPYDREQTTMKKFQMCPGCHHEFHEPTDRRFYSQTNSCPACRIEMEWLDKNGKLISNHQTAIIALASDALKRGAIIALKGIGGYLLMADANQSVPIQTLRDRKHRPAKPFAVLYPNLELAKRDLHINVDESTALLSHEAPIVLCDLKKGIKPIIQNELIAPNLNRIGVMLPYAPILDMLANEFGGALIATSGNRSGYPIFFKDKLAIEQLGEIADFFLINNRDIVVPQDDSVIQFSKKGLRIMMRRSRGYAPNVIAPGVLAKNDGVLCMGAMLKSAVFLQQSGHQYLSQYIGNTETLDVMNTYRQVYGHLAELLHFQPKEILIDGHPDYSTTRFGQELCDLHRVRVRSVQHHEAHFAAVLAEHDLLDANVPILGVIWDGTGLGNDGQIWGGEFFTCGNQVIRRINHIDYFPYIGGDKMAKEPRLAALSLLVSNRKYQDLVKPKFTDFEWRNYQRLVDLDEQLKTSSMGRIFDGVASILGLCDKQSFEGEAAMKLQVIAEQLSEESKAKMTPYQLHEMSIAPVIKQIAEDLNLGTQKEIIAYRFHLTLVALIQDVATKTAIDRIAFSGGVFQNSLLVDLIIDQLGDHFQLYWHYVLSSNDENIAYGQWARTKLMPQVDQTLNKEEETCASQYPVK